MGPSSPDYDSTGIEYYTIPSFTFQSGHTVRDLAVAYRSFNPSAAATHGTVLIPTCMGGLINTTQTFSAAPYSSLRPYHIVVAAMLGNGESASPSTHLHFPPNPPTPIPTHSDARAGVTYPDVIHAHHALLTQHLSVAGPLEAIVGFSMGAQQAYHWAVMYPTYARRIVALCGSARTSPHNYAFLEGPIATLTRSTDYQTWRAELQPILAHASSHSAETTDATISRTETQALLARRAALAKPVSGLGGFCRTYNAWLTSTIWFRERWWSARGASTSSEQGNADAGLGFATIEAMIAAMSDPEMAAWDPEDALALARMWQAGDIGAVFVAGSEVRSEPASSAAAAAGKEKTETKTGGGTTIGLLGGGTGNDEYFRRALESIQARVLVMPCRTDQFFPPEDGEIEVNIMNGAGAGRGDTQRHEMGKPTARLEVIPSIWGHVAGGGMNARDLVWIDERIGAFMHEE